MENVFIRENIIIIIISYHEHFNISPLSHMPAEEVPIFIKNSYFAHRIFHFTIHNVTKATESGGWKCLNFLLVSFLVLPLFFFANKSFSLLGSIPFTDTDCLYARDEIQIMSVFHDEKFFDPFISFFNLTAPAPWPLFCLLHSCSSNKKFERSRWRGDNFQFSNYLRSESFLPFWNYCECISVDKN